MNLRESYVKASVETYRKRGYDKKQNFYGILQGMTIGIIGLGVSILYALNRHYTSSITFWLWLLAVLIYCAIVPIILIIGVIVNKLHAVFQILPFYFIIGFWGIELFSLDIRWSLIFFYLSLLTISVFVRVIIDYKIGTKYLKNPGSPLVKGKDTSSSQRSSPH